MKKYTTYSGSVWLVDEVAKTVHRTGADHYTGKSNTGPTPYLDLTDAVGRLIIDWGESEEHSRFTISSQIQSTEEL